MVGPKKQSEVKKAILQHCWLQVPNAKCMGSLIVHQPCRIRQLHGSLGSGTAHLAGNVSALKENQCTPLRAVGTEANYQHYRFYIMHAYDEFHVCNRLRRFSWRGELFGEKWKDHPFQRVQYQCIFTHDWTTQNEEKKKSKESLG